MRKYELYMVEEIQHRLLKYCALSSITKQRNGILSFLIDEKIRLFYLEDSFFKFGLERAYVTILETLLKLGANNAKN